MQWLDGIVQLKRSNFAVVKTEFPQAVEEHAQHPAGTNFLCHQTHLDLAISSD